MIPKITSHEFNDILNSANNKLNNMIEDINFIKTNISKKIKILNYESQYMSKKIKDIENTKINTIISESPGQNDSIFAYPMQEVGDFENFGYTFCSSFKKNPINTFNILTTKTGEAFFRDIADVYINGINKDEYKNILKYDNISDKDFYFEDNFEQYKTIDITIILDKTKTIGNALFNSIELDTFLSGSYDIDYIKIYEDNSEDSKYDEYKDIENTGTLRLIFDKEYEFKKVSIGIKPKFSISKNGIITSVIGIRHIYFYNLSLNSDSYIYVEINSNNYIDKIDNKISIIKPDEIIDINADDNGIEFYLKHYYDSTSKKHTFEVIQEPSTENNIKEISLNIKTIYAKIPLKILSKHKNKTAIGFKFNISNKIF